MLQFCKALKQLNLSTFNTKNATNMSWLVYHCELLEELDISNFNTENDTDLSCMFVIVQHYKK